MNLFGAEPPSAEVKLSASMSLSPHQLGVTGAVSPKNAQGQPGFQFGAGSEQAPPG